MGLAYVVSIVGVSKLHRDFSFNLKPKIRKRKKKEEKEKKEDKN